MKQATVLIAGVVLLLQAVPESQAGTTDPDPAAEQTSTGRLISTGLLWGGGGFLLGFALGAGITPDTNPEGTEGNWDAFENGMIAGSATGAISLSYGIHHGNRKRGELGWVLLTSVGLGAAGVGLTYANENIVILPVTVLAQFIACIAVERKTAGTSRPQEHNTGSADPSILDADEPLTSPTSYPATTIHVGPVNGGLGLIIRRGF